MRVIKKIARVFFIICIVIIAIYSILVMVQKLTKNQIPEVFGFKNFIILSGSMEPTLNIGDVIIVRDAKEIQKGDIISFKLENSIVTHRVEKIIKEDGKILYETMGDANSGVDMDLVKPEDIVGKFYFRIPLIGNVVLFFQSKQGIIILIVTLLLMLITNFRKDNEEEEGNLEGIDNNEINSKNENIAYMKNNKTRIEIEAIKELKELKKINLVYEDDEYVYDDTEYIDDIIEYVDDDLNDKE